MVSKRPLLLWDCCGRPSHSLSPAQVGPPQVWDLPLEQQKTSLISASRPKGHSPFRPRAFLHTTDLEFGVHEHPSPRQQLSDWSRERQPAQHHFFTQVTSFYIMSQKSSWLPAAQRCSGLCSKPSLWSRTSSSPQVCSLLHSKEPVCEGPIMAFLCHSNSSTLTRVFL